MEEFNQIFSNDLLWATIFSWFLAQCLKIIVFLSKGRKFDFKWFIQPGGFPSSHSSAVSALATASGIEYGFDSPIFAVTAVLAVIVIFDARITRGTLGRQAEVLNKITESLAKRQKIRLSYVREFIGHTSFEVFGGVLLGILIGILFSLK